MINRNKMNTDETSNLQISWEKTATRQDEVIIDILLEFLNHAIETTDPDHE